MKTSKIDNVIKISDVIVSKDLLFKQISLIKYYHHTKHHVWGAPKRLYPRRMVII